MKKILLLIIFASTCTFAQEHALVYFTEKPDAAAALETPQDLFSERAYERKLLRGTAIDSRDVPVHEPFIRDLKTRSGFDVKVKSKWFNSVYVIGERNAIEDLQNLAFVDRVQFMQDISSRQQNLPQKYENKLETEIDFNYAATSNQVSMLNLQNLHQQDHTGNGMIIAVMDSGFPNVHSLSSFQKLRNNGKLLGGYDFTNRSTNVSESTLNNHGTLVLSTMAGYSENVFVGTAPDASYYLFVTEVAATETPVEEAYWVEAAERADSLGVDIINTSLGYTQYDNPAYSYTPQDMDGQTSFISKGATMAMEKGMLVVTSAGNRGNEDNFKIIGAPADANVLAVGGVDPAGNYAIFSSTGPSADGRIKPEVVAQAIEVAAINEQNMLVGVNGTSFSSPIIAGAIACFWELNREWNNFEVMELIKELGHLSNSPNNLLGHGIPDFSTSGNAMIPDASELVLYQNPVEDILKFAGPEDRYDIHIFNTAGIMIRSEKSVSSEIDLSAFSRGVYIAMFESESTIEKFLIIKK
ncbi:S8 family serine peptidase [Christiangramia portivictoriae]|uniref:S8 family serine peptidase n=1 Tax=Christiangramia portivictoriae TaxID=326069 RepID=UPI0004039923|nr:S8 family serine peptidase [Christiangramia portivictoriae]